MARAFGPCGCRLVRSNHYRATTWLSLGCTGGSQRQAQGPLPQRQRHTGDSRPVLARSGPQTKPEQVVAEARRSPEIVRDVPVAPPPTATDEAGSSRAEGYATLLAVSLLWGTYSPCVKYLYATDKAVDAASLTAVRSSLSSAALLAAAAVKKDGGKGQSGDGGGAALPGASAALGSLTTEPAPEAPTRTTTDALAAAAPPAASTSGAAAPPPPSSSSSSSSWGALPLASGGLALLSRIPLTYTGGFELGVWNFLGSLLQAQGLLSTSATRAAFLVQLTSLLTPVLSWVAGEAIPPMVWFACLLGLCGSCFIAYDGTQQAAASHGGAVAGGGLLTGDLYLLLSCFFFALATVRLGKFAGRCEAVTLAAVKKTSLAAVSVAWFLGTTLLTDRGAGGGDHPLAWPSQPLSWLLVAYTAVGPGAAGAYLQTRGQAVISPAQAQVMFSLTPLWAVLLAQLTLGGEAIGPWAWAGGSTILVAGLISAKAQNK